MTGTITLPPAEHLQWIGSTGPDQFIRVGRRYRDFLVEDCGLVGEHRFLDIGCGTGRIAIALADVIRPPGAYVGFDVWRGGVDWCRAAITPQRPWFRFEHADIAEAHLNPDGRLAVEEWRFPVADASIDRALALSVFTHLDAPTARHYLRELARSLKPDGIALVTVFLVDDAGAAHLAGWPHGPALLAGDRAPLLDRFGKDLFAAWDPAALDAELAAAGLRAVRREAGDWCGRAPARPDRPHHQDHLYLAAAPR
ncbi:MAG: class I SAM-dependent methyltransferase [Alphaproteobacteria bacterium]|nr:class I SAM-dependent methyltransferase [Alphaproteobacteria bacterium]